MTDLKIRPIKHSILCCLLLCTTPVAAQSFSGYASAMPSIIAQHPADDIWWQGLFHFRTNFEWQISPHLRTDVSFRSRLMFGSSELIDANTAKHDRGLFKMATNWWVVESWEPMTILGNTIFDRLNITYEKDQWKLQLGRQRINWGQTFVWNPNDIFNTYSFFDFDYPERPGCDAFRATYYHSATSSSEVAISYRDSAVTAALLHRWNRNNIDYQLITGLHAESDFVIGGAVTGDFNGLNYRSELSYFHPIKTGDNSGTIAISAGGDYIFSNSLMLQAEVLYNNVSKGLAGGGLMAMYAAPLSAKNLSVSDWNIFASASYPLTSRLNGSLSSMYFVDVKSCYVGISLDFSLVENLDLSLVTQYFYTFDSSMGDMQVFLGFLRLKYSF